MLSIREAKEEDLELMMAWRSTPAVYCGFIKQRRPLTWEEHYNWWKKRKYRKDWIICLDGRSIGVVALSELCYVPSINIYIGETTVWGQGLGRQALALALSETKGKVRAYILNENKGSQRMFESIGFRKAFECEPNEWIYEIL